MAIDIFRTHGDDSGRSAPPFEGSTELIQQESTQLLIHQLGEIRETFARCSEAIWGFGFDPTKIPILFVSSEETTGTRFGMTSGPVDPALLTAVDGGAYHDTASVGISGQRRQTDQRRSASSPMFVVNDAIAAAFWPCDDDDVLFTPDLAGQEGIVFDISRRTYGPDSWEFARFLVHEAFHHYQLFQAMWPVPVGYDPATPPLESAANDAAKSAEGRLIELAALADREDDAKGFVGRYLVNRAVRYQRFPEVEMLERGTEQVEGSARYVENQYSRCNGRSARLNIPPEALRADRDWQQFGRLYRTGARILELLDRFGVDWRERLANGEDPYGILRSELR